MEALKFLGVMALVALPLAVVFLVVPPGLRLGGGHPAEPRATGLVAPYRLHKPAPAILEKEIAFYQERIRRDPGGGLDLAALAQVYLKKARSSGEASWYLLADQAARRSVANLPAFNNGALLVLAQVAQARHDFSEALRLAQRVLKSEAGNEEALSIQVTAYLAMGRVDAATRTVEKLVRQVANTGTLTERALVRLARGQEVAAIRDFRLALAAEQPGELESAARTRMLLGRLHFHRGRHGLASELYREALGILPQSPLALGYLAELETRTGQLEAAERHYEQAFAVSPLATYLLGMARVKALQGDPVQARELRSRAESMLRRELTGGAFGHRQELVHRLLERGRRADIAEALSLIRAELHVRRDAETQETLAWALARSGRWHQARAAMRHALRWGRRDADMFYRAGTIEQALGKRDRAVSFFQRALLTNPSFERAEQARKALRKAAKESGDRTL